VRTKPGARHMVPTLRHGGFLREGVEERGCVPTPIRFLLPSPRHAFDAAALRLIPRHFVSDRTLHRGAIHVGTHLEPGQLSLYVSYVRRCVTGPAAVRARSSRRRPAERAALLVDTTRTTTVKRRE
jgi:hypothetical protein